MYIRIRKWIRENYENITNSIAFAPVLILVVFLLISWVMLFFDFSETGKQLKASLRWLSLRDSSTARVIVSTVTAGVISIAVFSFSMVMIVLNQAASQLSNRVLNSLIGNRFQQIVLGIYIGTIVYGLLLLTTIRDIDSGIYIPTLSIYLLIFFSVVDIFLFIYFLHHITQSVKYETIIRKIYQATKESMKGARWQQPPLNIKSDHFYVLTAPTSNYFQNFDLNELVKIASAANICIEFLHPGGKFLLQGSPLLKIHNCTSIDDELQQRIERSIDFYHGQPIEVNPLYGFHNLSEIAIKALSPGINDPTTAVLSTHLLADLFRIRLQHPEKNRFEDEGGQIRVITYIPDFDELFKECIYPIWNYGKNDRYIQHALCDMIEQLLHTSMGIPLEAAVRLKEAISRKDPH